jgi:hypothetical protein
MSPMVAIKSNKDNKDRVATWGVGQHGLPS